MERSGFLERHRQVIAIGSWFVYLVTNAIVESFSTLTEYGRLGNQLETWEPFTWELTSAALIGVLIVGIARLDRVVPFSKESWHRALPMHLVATIPFSLAHIGGMVGLRHLIYATAGSRYVFGPLATEFPYEFRKEFVTYWFILGVIYLWRHLRRMNATHSVEEDSAETPIERLVARKRGAEFPIAASDVHWIEASGNYANLHLESGVFPVRSSMAELERRLDPSRFVRVHRSYIANLDNIEEIRPTESGDYLIRMQTGDQVRCSRRYRSALKGRFDRF